MMSSAINTAADHERLQFVAYVDDDDEETLRRFSEPDFEGFNLVVHRAPRIVMSDMWNALIPDANGEILMLAADDLVFRSLGWDLMVGRAFADCEDRILYAHGDDLSGAGQFYGTHGFVHRRWIDTLGYFSGPGFSADFADLWVTQIAEFIGRRRYLPMITEHQHHVFGKAACDDTYRETVERLTRDNTPAVYRDRLPERVNDAQKLMAKMYWKA
jgi:hypothetical protein